MLHEIDFVSFIHDLTDQKSERDRSIMARVALNALYDAELFPVDLSEVMSLRGKHAVLTRAFISWCLLEPIAFQRWSEFASSALIPYVRPKQATQ